MHSNFVLPYLSRQRVEIIQQHGEQKADEDRKRV
jgi:hypothetical protein